MKIYFIRHGETKYNASQIHQPENAELSESGIKQAEVLAKRFSKIPIDIIYSSPLKRAKQTAEIINKTLKKKIVYSNFLKERKSPSEFIGKRRGGLEILRINKIRNLHENDPFWHYSDEENFIEFKKRVKKFFNVLDKTKKENVLVISHGGPIKMMIFLMTGDKFTPKFFYKFLDLFKLSNTGITFCNLCKKDKKSAWSVQSFNDHAHLG